MASDNDTETVKIDIELGGIDIHLGGKRKINHGQDKINCTVRGGDGKPLLQWNNEPETWIEQVKNAYKDLSSENRKLKTSPDVSIYRVPESIKKTKQGAYDPLVVFLGPYHHKKDQQLTTMDKYKLQALNKTLQRLQMDMHEVEKVVKERIEDIRDCYEDSASEWDDDTLVWMMIIDACFILEFLRMDLLNSSLIFHFQRGGNIKRREVMLDILKLENQIPFCVLQMILQLELKDNALVRDFFAILLSGSNGIYFSGYPFWNVTQEENGIKKHIESRPLHLLDLSRRVIADFLSNYVPIADNNCWECNNRCGTSNCIATPNAVACFRGRGWELLHRSYRTYKIPSAYKLQKAGIKLQLSAEGKFKFKHRCFRNSKLFLPRITVDDYTEIFLRNLVAFEECQRHKNSEIERVISLNMFIMDNLIDSKEDVELFQRAGIIENYLGTDEEVAQIFNDLCFGITTKVDFQPTLDMINKQYNSRLNVWITELWRSHCSKPWYIISLLVAVILLVLTLLQTIYTMKSYFNS